MGLGIRGRAQCGSRYTYLSEAQTMDGDRMTRLDSLDAATLASWLDVSEGAASTNDADTMDNTTTPCASTSGQPLGPKNDSLHRAKKQK